MEEFSYRFFCNRDCKYFPCHENADPENFSCLFCYCPLYALGKGCGGNFRYLENGVKDCSGCLLPHNPASYDYITGKYKKIDEVIHLVDSADPAAKNT